jgi:DNA-binding HxlR family transcriptional regulator
MQKEPSFHHFHVQHFCPVAQTLERLGDRWSFLIVRDLMHGPLRFTDLQHYLAGITPKRLTVQLRALESEGIVEREREEGRREVWYRLTAKGKGLVPVIRALAVWGMEYSTRAPLPGETVYPEHTMGVLSLYLNQRGLRLPQPVKWTVRFGEKSVFTISFDGKQWSVEPTDAPDADVRIETTVEAWAAFFYSSKDERQQFLEAMRISGEQARVNEFLDINWIEKQPSL